MYIPDGVLTTACVPGCPSRITWWYDQGEPLARDHPGTDDEVWPAGGCSDDHRMALAYDQTYASWEATIWGQLAQYGRLCDLGYRLWISSLQYLAGPGQTVTLDNDVDGHLTRRRFRVPSRNSWEHDDDLPY